MRWSINQCIVFCLYISPYIIILYWMSSLVSNISHTWISTAVCMVHMYCFMYMYLDMDDTHILSENIKFICTTLGKRNKDEPLTSTNKFYVSQQSTYIVFILQCHVQSNLPHAVTSIKQTSVLKGQLFLVLS